MLRDTIQSFMEVEFPSGVEVELLVVDNNSTDSTRSVVESLRQRWPEVIRYAFEGTAGLSHARNAAIRATRADVLAFIDDDVYLDRSWLLMMADFLVRNPDAMCLGGKSTPFFEGRGRPAWLVDDFLSFYGFNGAGDTPAEMIYPWYPFGLNMAMRRSVFDRIGGFNVQLGRIGSSLLSGEETEFFLRVAKAGMRVCFVPGMGLRHRIPETRATTAWLLKRSYSQGVTETIMRMMIDRPSKGRLVKEACALLVASFVGLREWRDLARKTRFYKRLGTLAQTFRCMLASQRYRPIRHLTSA